MDLENPYLYLEKISGGQGFSRSITRVDTKRVPAVNFSYQGLLVQTYIRCHGSSDWAPPPEAHLVQFGGRGE